MKALYLLLVPSLLLGQEVTPPQRGEERREPNRVERPEPMRVQSPIQEERQRPVDSPRPVEPQRPQQPPVIGNRPPIGYVDPFFYPRPYDCWSCRNRVSVEMGMSRRLRMTNRRRPTRIEMAPPREPLTEKQKKALLELRNEFIQKRNRILNNP
jgi:hypothetical protein